MESKKILLPFKWDDKNFMQDVRKIPDSGAISVSNVEWKNYLTWQNASNQPSERSWNFSGEKSMFTFIPYDPKYREKIT